MAARIYKRSAQVTDGSRRWSAEAWVVEKDTDKPGVVEIIRCSSEQDAVRECGERPANRPWQMPARREFTEDWKL